MEPTFPHNDLAAMNPRRAMLAGIGGLAAGAFLASTANAGPLNPPPGPITPTPGPEPRTAINQINTPGDATTVFRITQSGSYYLTGNLSIPTGLVGIEITVGDVTLDLNGFQIAGFLNTSSHGISVATSIQRRNITVRNGTVVQCGGSGVNLATSITSVVEQLRVTNNTGDGIRTGDNSRVSDCTVGNNGGKGIILGKNAIVQNCIAVSNTGVDIETGSITPGSEPRIPIDPRTTPGDANNTFLITQPGSYYFPGNLSGQPQKSGILIASSDVTIDMMGFRLQPVNVGSGSGILNSGNRVNITIRNGVVTKWEGAGIDLSAGGAGTQCSNIRIEGVTVTENLARGIRAGQNAIVQNCIAQANGGTGIEAGFSSAIQNCIARSNTGTGIQTANRGAILNCTASQNASGFSAGTSSSVSRCIADANSGNGISLIRDGIATECTAANNGGAGVSGGSNATVIGCNANSNGGNGILVENYSVVQECLCQNNQQTGIFADFSCTITKCTATFSSTSGISVGDACLVLQNSCCATVNSPGAGIRTLGSRNRIEENNCATNNVGILCVNSGNFIARNTCSSNATNWNIAAGNKCLVIAGVDATAINGNSGGTSPGSTNPFANFTY